MMTIERGTLADENSSLAERYAAIQENYLSAQEEFTNLKQDFTQLQLAKETLEQKLKDMADSRVKLKTIIVESDDDEEEEVAFKEEYFSEEDAFFEELEEEVAARKDTIEGEVLAVNKEYEFLVVSLGLKDGITEDSDISIYRGYNLVAIGGIEKLYENISAVIVNDIGQLRKIKVGDLAVASVEE